MSAVVGRVAVRFFWAGFFAVVFAGARPRVGFFLVEWVDVFFRAAEVFALPDARRELEREVVDRDTAPSP